MFNEAVLPESGVQAPKLPPGALVLKYLFCAELTGGRIVEQTPEDKHPIVAGRPASYELICKHFNGDPIIHPDGRLIYRDDILLFQLEDATHRYLVDLSDGHFEIQYAKGKQVIGAPFYLAFPPLGSKIRLFFFKRRRHHTLVHGTVQDDMSVKLTGVEETSQECEYHFGWETEDKKTRAELILV